MKNIRITVYFIIMFYFIGCYSYENIETRNQLIEYGEGEISLLTRDSTKYFLHNVALKDSVLSGDGTMEKNGITNEFNGNLYLSNIIFIQAEDFGFWKSVAAVGAIGFLGIMTYSILQDEHEGVDVKIVYPSSGGSCPFIYSHNNSEFILEGEAIPLSLGKALEMETINSLSHLIPENNELDIRITNERPETHYINSVKLFKYESELSNDLLADADKNVWPVLDPKTPIYAEDYNKNNIMTDIIEEDNNYWTSDLSAAVPTAGFTDAIVLTFPKENNQSSSSLIIKAINTRISDILFRKVYDFMGEEVLNFIYAIENDPTMISSLKYWLKEVSLKAFVWNGNVWEYAGMTYPEATRKPFKKLIRINLKDIKTDDLKIKLEFMTDVWKIDAVSMDFSDVEPIQPDQLPLESVKINNEVVSEKISQNDNKYSVLLPGDKMDLKFYDKDYRANARYFLNVRGYLYEWYVKKPDTVADFTEFKTPGVSRLDLFKVILKNKDLLLPPIYYEWKQGRETL